MTASLSFFCDFDGTIADSDMIATIMRKFAPDEAGRVIAQITAGTVTVKDGVEQLFALLPSARFNEIRAFAMSAVSIRQGFASFCELCEQRRWPLRVVTGGFDFFVEPALSRFGAHLQIYCNRLDASGEYLRVVWAVPCEAPCTGGCGLCKPTVMQRSGDTGLRIVIGDGVTDRRAAAQADFVFARDRLLTICAEQGWPHARFDTFDDVIRRLEMGLYQE